MCELPDRIRIKVHSGFRIVIPKHLREKYNIKRGTIIELEDREGKMIILRVLIS